MPHTGDYGGRGSANIPGRFLDLARSFQQAQPVTRTNYTGGLSGALARGVQGRRRGRGRVASDFQNRLGGRGVSQRPVADFQDRRSVQAASQGSARPGELPVGSPAPPGFADQPILNDPQFFEFPAGSPSNRASQRATPTPLQTFTASQLRGGRSLGGGAIQRQVGGVAARTGLFTQPTDAISRSNRFGAGGGTPSLDGTGPKNPPAGYELNGAGNLAFNPLDPAAPTMRWNGTRWVAVQLQEARIA